MRREYLSAVGAWLWLMIALDLVAGEVPTAPMLRVETGHHTAFIQSLVYDERQQRLITVSDDKTIRVWQLPTLDAVATYRVPIASGYEGQLYTAALSPDGRTLAVAGWTGWQWDNKGAIYLLDLASGDITGRITGFDEVIGPLAFSPDGKYLALGLLGRQGLHILNTDDHSVVAWDIDYLDKTIGLTFTPEGGIITTSLDGYVRLYDNEFRLIGRVKAGLAGARPFGARLSPDGSEIAIGFHDVAAITVLSARDLSLRYSARYPELEQGNLTTVAWSADGQALYAGGDGGAGASPIYRIGDRGRGRIERLASAEARISQIGVLPDGDIVYVAEDPAIAVLDGASGRRRAYVGPETVDFRYTQRSLRISQDGTVVQFGYGRDGGAFGRYSLRDQELRSSDREDRALSPPLLSAPGLSVKPDGERPSINGVAVKLDDYERVHAYAITPDHHHVVMGTEWALRLYDREGVQRWRVNLPASAWAVNASGDGRYALAALSDGTVRWFGLVDGVEVLALFAHRNRTEWIAWIPSGYYMSSAYGDNYIGWHVNRGKETSPDFYLAVQFERILYRPDVVVASFGGAPATVTPPRATFDVARLTTIAPPRINIESMSLGPGARGPAALNIKFSVHDNGLSMQDYAVYVNNVPVTPRDDRRLKAGEARGFSRKLSLALPAKVNRVRIEVFNEQSMGVAERYVLAAGTEDVAPPVGDMYLLAIGVNHFPKLDRGIDLNYAAQDAGGIASAIARAAHGYYKRVHTQVLSDFSDIKPDKTKIQDALKFIQRARGEDTVMIFLASHGISDAAGNYYFVPRDASAEDVRSVLEGGADEARPSLVSWRDFFDALRTTAGRRLLIVDTCQARNIEGRMDTHTLIKRSAASRFAFVLASKGGEESQEYEPGKHGLFTYALLDAVEGPSDRNGDGLISTHEWFDYSAPMVEALRDKSIGTQTPQLLAPQPLGEFPLLRRPAK